MAEILNNFGIIGKRLSKKTLLELLHYIEGDSPSYLDQLHKVKDSLVNYKKLVCYKGKYRFFTFNVDTDKNRVITNFSFVTCPPYDYF